MDGVLRYQEYVKRNRDMLGTRFIKSGGAFFEDEFWKDQWGETLTEGKSTRKRGDLTTQELFDSWGDRLTPGNGEDCGLYAISETIAADPNIH